MENLSPLKTYFVVAYAQTTEGIIYSQVDSFETGWVQKSDDRIRHNGTSFTIGNTAYVGLGYFNPDQGRGDAFYFYNPLIDDWQTVDERFPGGCRADLLSFTLNGKAYVGTGLDRDNGSIKYRDFFEFNPESGTWNPIAPLPEPARSGGFAFVVHNRAFVAGGFGNGTGLLNEVYEFDPDNPEQPWMLQPGMVFPGQSNRVYPSYWSFPEKAYFGFGEINGNRARDLWKFDTNSAEPWIRVNDLPESGLPRSGCIAFTIQNKGYLLGGFYGPNNPSDELWEFCTD